MAYTTAENAAALDLQLDIMLVGQQSNVPGTLLTVLEYITVHDTANPKSGAGATMHQKFVASGGGPDHVSFTYTVDDIHAIQILPENWDNWAQGNSQGNDRSLSIELCVNSDADKAKARDNLAKLIAAIREANGITLSKVVQHNYWRRKDGTYKNCPASIRAEPHGWDDLLTSVSGYVLALRHPVPALLVLNNIEIKAPYRAIFEQGGGINRFGLPLTGVEPLPPAGAGPVLQVMWFERSRIEVWPDGNVTFGRVGAEALRAYRGK